MARLLPLALEGFLHPHHLRPTSTMRQTNTFPSFEYMHCPFHLISYTTLARLCRPMLKPNSSHRSPSRTLRSRQREHETSSKRQPSRTRSQEGEAEEELRLQLHEEVSRSNHTPTASPRSPTIRKLHRSRTPDHHPRLVRYLVPAPVSSLDRRASPPIPGH
jgi:hypothetical protein